VSNITPRSDPINQPTVVASTPKSDTFNVMSTAYTVEKVERAMRELANSEATTSLAWLPSNPLCLITGTGTKWMRIYDLRGLFLIALIVFIPLIRSLNSF
jgi:hypothetical protein